MTSVFRRYAPAPAAAAHPPAAGDEARAPVVLMVSGGADSTALLVLAATSALDVGDGRGVARIARERLHVLHVNHQLRGLDAEEDEEFVHELAARYGIPCTVRRVDVAALAGAGRETSRAAGGAGAVGCEPAAGGGAMRAVIGMRERHATAPDLDVGEVGTGEAAAGSRIAGMATADAKAEADEAGDGGEAARREPAAGFAAGGGPRHAQATTNLEAVGHEWDQADVAGRIAGMAAGGMSGVAEAGAGAAGREPAGGAAAGSAGGAPAPGAGRADRMTSTDRPTATGDGRGGGAPAGTPAAHGAPGADLRLAPATTNLEAVGREARYAAAAALADELSAEAGTPRSAARILTAHTANDRTETFLMNTLRGTGMAGLTSIPRQRGRVVRPLLDRTHEELCELLRMRGIVWREDATNADTRYLRAFVRHEVLPPLLARNPRLMASVSTTCDLLSDEDAYLTRVAARALRDLTRRQAPGLVALDAARLAATEVAVARRVVRAALLAVCPDARLEARHVAAVLACVARGAGSVTVPVDVDARVAHGLLLVRAARAGDAGRVTIAAWLEVPGLGGREGAGGAAARGAGLGCVPVRDVGAGGGPARSAERDPAWVAAAARAGAWPEALVAPIGIARGGRAGAAGGRLAPRSRVAAGDATVGRLQLPDGRTLTARLVTAPAGSRAPELARAHATEWAGASVLLDSAACGVDATGGGRLWVDAPAAGDVLCPLGMHGQSKKLSDLLGEAGVPVGERADVPVVRTSPTGGVLWVGGVRPDERARCLPSSRTLLELTLHPAPGPHPLRGPREGSGRTAGPGA